MKQQAQENVNNYTANCLSFLTNKSVTLRSLIWLLVFYLIPERDAESAHEL